MSINLNALLTNFVSGGIQSKDLGEAKRIRTLNVFLLIFIIVTPLLGVFYSLVGADLLFLLNGGVDLYHPTCVRASMGTLFWKQVVQSDFDAFRHWVKGRGYKLVGASAHAQVDYRETNLGDAPWVLLLGSEQKGLSDEQMAACDVTVSMSMHGKVSSLNLAVAAGILLYALNA